MTHGLVSEHVKVCACCTAAADMSPPSMDVFGSLSRLAAWAERMQNARRCVYQREDDAGVVGVELNRDLVKVASKALERNLTRLGPLVLPLGEKAAFAASLFARKVLGMKRKPYVPDFRRAFNHFCLHAGDPQPRSAGYILATPAVGQAGSQPLWKASRSERVGQAVESVKRACSAASLAAFMTRCCQMPLPLSTVASRCQRSRMMMLLAGVQCCGCGCRRARRD